MKKNINKFGIWKQPVQITPNNFIHKSLSEWSVNLAVGCSHGCLFCYVPDVSTIKQGPTLEDFGVKNPDSEWGQYAFLRPWDENGFLDSLLKAQMTPPDKLSWDGHRAVMFCTTTDPYQVLKGHPDQNKLNAYEKLTRRRSLTLIRDCSDINVRILTRSPSAKTDFDLFKSFGNRFMFGMSIPTLNDTLARVYEPGTSSVTKRLETLRLAKDAGIPIYVAIAPTYAECDAADLEKTLTEIAKLDPVCIYHEPINIRADNVKRIEENAKAQGVPLNTKVFENREAWCRYAMQQLFTVQRLAEKLGVIDRLKLWPDPDLRTKSRFLLIRKQDREKKLGQVQSTPEARRESEAANELAYQHHVKWLEGWWSKLAPWPGVEAQTGWTAPAIPTDSPFAVPLPDKLK